MKTVLFVSYFYPPFDTTAAVEASKLSRYLPEYGWSPIILTGASDYTPSLPVEVEESRIHRTRFFDVNGLPKRFLRGEASFVGYVPDERKWFGRAVATAEYVYRQLVNFPDGQIGWFPFAVKEGRALIERHQPDLIFSMAGPFTSHLVASRLSSENAIPWFADFRDLWTENHYFRRRQPLLALERILERRTVSRAAALSVPTAGWSRSLEKRFDKPTWLIPNGFDPADIPADVTPSDKFVLTYTGVFYRNAQDMTPLLDALVELRRDGTIDSNSFELRLIGRYLLSLRESVRNRGLESLVTFKHPVTHAQALREQAASTALLFVLWATPEGRGWLSGKVYEYMGARRPILALGPPTVDAADLVISMGAGEVAPDALAVADILRRWIKEFGATTTLDARTDSEQLAAYEWRQIARQLAVAFRSIGT